MWNNLLFFCAYLGFSLAYVYFLFAAAYFFASAFEDLGASTENEDFMSTIREQAYIFMVLGAIICCSMAVQGTLCEAAAALMTRKLQTAWFRALYVF